jgi:hypothetical protein
MLEAAADLAASRMTPTGFPPILRHCHALGSNIVNPSRGQAFEKYEPELTQTDIERARETGQTLLVLEALLLSLRRTISGSLR